MVDQMSSNKSSGVNVSSQDDSIKLAQTPSVNLVGELLELDDKLLRAQGHESQLDRSFSKLGAVGLAYSITNSWLTYASCFGANLNYGGGVTAVFGLIVASAVQWVVLIGLAELCSAFPSSGGQYHFSYIIAPKRTRNFAAFATGSINVLAWWITTSSGTLYTAISAFGIAAVVYPSFASQQWQVYLCYLLVIVLSLIPVLTIHQRHLDKMTKFSMLLSFIGIILVCIVCLVMGRGHYQPGSALIKWQGVSGWNVGTSWLLSIGIGMYCFAGTGAVTHIAEELPQPGRRLPQVINMTMAVGTIVAVPWIIVMVFCIQDLEAVQTSFLPSFEVFHQATGSKSAAIALQSYLTVLFFSCIPSQWITSSRIAWAFSRDQGLPFASYWQHIDTKRGIPVRTTLLSASFCVIYGLLYIASTAAYNSIINCAVLMLNITFTIPQAILCTTGRSKLPPRVFDLGVFGYPVNIFSVIWLIVSGVIMCLPSTRHPTTTNMNYNAPVLAGIVLLLCLVWIERRRHFNGPQIDWDVLKIAQQGSIEVAKLEHEMHHPHHPHLHHHGQGSHNASRRQSTNARKDTNSRDDIDTQDV